MDTGRGVQYEGEGRQVERTGTSVPARASAAVVSKLPEREGVVEAAVEVEAECAPEVAFSWAFVSCLSSRVT